jgi:hypothetical protein
MRAVLWNLGGITTVDASFSTRILVLHFYRRSAVPAEGCLQFGIQGYRPKMGEATAAFGVGQRWDGVGLARYRIGGRGRLVHADLHDGAQITGVDGHVWVQVVSTVRTDLDLASLCS